MTLTEDHDVIEASPRIEPMTRSTIPWLEDDEMRETAQRESKNA